MFVVLILYGYRDFNVFVIDRIFKDFFYFRNENIYCLIV